MTTIYPVILCGGTGSRLWPVSRIQSPKQFMPVDQPDGLTMFQATVQRQSGIDFGDPIVITGSKHADLVQRQLTDIQANGTIIAEPMGRNTGPAVLAAALAAVEKDPEAILLVAPSDHIIRGSMVDAITVGKRAAEGGRIVLFGVEPNYPETGYGYITDGGMFEGNPGLHRVAQFIEKPPLKQAQALNESGLAYWSTGISMFRAENMVREFKRLAPETYEAVTQALVDAAPIPAGRLLDAESFIKAEDEPTERLVFERTDRVALVPVGGIEWDDVGAWNAVFGISEKDQDGNAISGDVIAIDTHDSLIRGNGRLVTVLGMENVVVVDTHDALLITQRKNSQGIKAVVQNLRDNNRSEVRHHVVEEQVWGQIEHLEECADFNMFKLSVRPGAHFETKDRTASACMLTVVAGSGLLSQSERVTPIPEGSFKRLAAGENARVDNTGDRDLQIVMVVMHGSRAAVPPEHQAPLDEMVSNG